jgi:succinate dehydrogenase / fumarate reductase cytochrome b subunit
MSFLLRYVNSSIGKKQVVAATGLLLVGFLIAHLAGNLLVFRGPAAFNEYSETLTKNPLIYVAEAGLAAIFLVHIGATLSLTRANRDARPVGYAMVRSRGRPSRRTFASQWMILSGGLVAVFAVLHLMTFKFGPGLAAGYKFVDPAGHGEAVMRDIYRLEIEVFHRPLYVLWYAFAMGVLGLHLHHAITSSFETFGLDHPRWTPLVGQASRALAWLIAVGFLMIPLLVLFDVGVKP